MPRRQPTSRSCFVCGRENPVGLKVRWDEHPEARYPLMIYHGHFSADFTGFSTEPPDPGMDTSDYNERFKIFGYNKIQKQEAYDFYRQWTSPGFPRFLAGLPGVDFTGAGTACSGTT